ncbi:MAG: 50S ribosomal protein L18 [Acidobacteria bacterium]|nr:MAG: 50S ribosomal protein L18 [Acidobacteriota bacterium]
MSKIKTKEDARNRRKLRIRKHIAGTSEKPRLSVFRSLNHIYVQAIDDSTGKTILAASSKEVTAAKKGNRDAAKQVGELIASKCKQKGIDRVVFDRSGYLYHGRVKALAEAARAAGLKF